MIIGEIIGNVVAIIKKPELEKYKLLLVRPLFSKNKCSEQEEPIVAIDLVGAGFDEKVILLQGSQVQNALTEKAPVDAAIIGIVEDIHIKGEINNE